MTTPISVPGPPAAVLSAIIRANAAYPYNAGSPRQRRYARFAATDPPYSDGVAMPAYANLDANVAITGWLTSQGWGTQGVLTKTAAYTTGPADAVILADAGSAAFTVTLGDPTQSGWVNPGQRVSVIKTDSSSNDVTVTGSNGQKIAGGTSVTLSTSNGYTSVVFDGANWQVWAGLTVAGSTPTGSAGGDLGGTYPDPTVTGTHLASALPIAQGGTGNTTGQPSGTAGGDLSGSYPDPTVAAVNGVSVSGTASADAVLAASSSSAAAWSSLSSLGAALLTGGSYAAFTGPISSTEDITAGVAVLTFGTAISVNASAGNHFRVTLTADATLENPSSPTDGQKITFEIIQDSTGSRTLTYGTAYDFGTSGAPTLTTTANKRDLMGFCYSSSLGDWMYAGITQGF